MKSREELLIENKKLREALKPFAKGATQIPPNWPDGRGLLIAQKHPDNPKNHALLLSFISDYRLAQSALREYPDD